MELELGLKLTNVADDITSDFRIAKDRAGPVFVSRETDTMFFLTAHLKGYKRGNIKIEINEDGSLIGISGEKQVQETVMAGWKMYKKDKEMKGFKKVYRIPKWVILDKIEAKFNDEESTLTITMPKKVKGIHGTAIEEVEEKRVDEKSKARIRKDEEKPLSLHDLKGEEAGELVSPSIRGKANTSKDDEEKHENEDDIQEISEPKQDEETYYEQDVDKRLEEEKAGPSAIDEAEAGKGEEDEERPRRFKMCIPLVAGSTLLLTFFVFVIQMMRSKHQISRRKD